MNTQPTNEWNISAEEWKARQEKYMKNEPTNEEYKKWSVQALRKITSAIAPIGESKFEAVAEAVQELLISHLAFIEENIRKSKIWKLVPNTPRMIMCSDKELDNLLSSMKKHHEK